MIEIVKNILALIGTLTLVAIVFYIIITTVEKISILYEERKAKKITDFRRGYLYAICRFSTELKARLLDAITKEHLESVTNLINDVAEIVKEKQND